MPATIDPADQYSLTRGHRHPDCWVCAPTNGTGLNIGFVVEENGSISGVFPCCEEFTGYPGFLHGGVTSSLLDGAMTNCLLAHGNPGLTARLEVRFLHPVRIGRPAVVRARLKKTRGSLSILEAELSQDGEIVATAEGRFMDYPEGSIPDRRSEK